MLVKTITKGEINKKLKTFLVDKSDDPKITVRIYEREALLELFEEVYMRGATAGEKAGKRKIYKKLRALLCEKKL